MSKPSFLRKLFGGPPPDRPAAPEIMGLRLGGRFELDDTPLKLYESDWVTQGIARTQLIQAVGSVRLDNDAELLRFYTNDEAFVQVLAHGGRDENNIQDVKLWHFYNTETVGSDRDWRQLLDERVSRPEIELEGNIYSRVWSGAGAESPPVAMSETTYLEGGAVDRTDQFTMLYQREARGGRFEYVLLAAEEKWVEHRPERYLVTSTGIDLGRRDFTIVG